MASRRLNSDRFFTRGYTPQISTKTGKDRTNDNTMATVQATELRDDDRLYRRR
jgi:hypothetical protein